MSRAYLPLWIGLRYTRSKEKQSFLSLLSWFSLLGMTLGVAALIVVLSVMNGFQQEVRDRLLDLIAHGQLEQQDNSPLLNWQATQQLLQQEKNILAAAPLVGGEVMLSNGRALRAGVLQGVDVALEQAISPIAERMLVGDFNDLAQQNYGIVLGETLARALAVYVGDKVLVSLPQLTITPFGTSPRVKQFTVVGLFQVGADVDSSHAYIRLVDAQRLYGMKDSVQALRFKTQNIMQADATVQQLIEHLPAHYRVQSWSAQRSQLFSAIQMEKRMVALMLLMVVLVAACNLVSLLSMMVAKKREEIAVLRMMGMSRTAVLMLFLTQGLSLSFFGILLGTLGGLLIADSLTAIVQFIEQQWHIYLFDPDVFYISGLPSVILLSDVVKVVAISLFLSIVFSLYPAMQASKIQPVEALQDQ